MYKYTNRYLPMRSWTSKIPIDYDDCDEDTDGVHDKSKQKILGDEWQHERGRRQNF